MSTKRIIITVTELPPCHFDSLEDLKRFNESFTRKEPDSPDWPITREWFERTRKKIAGMKQRKKEAKTQ